MKSGDVISKNYVLENKINSLDELWGVLKANPSLFARHRPYPSAFIMSWSIKLISEWINKGWFWTIKRKDHE